MIAGLVNYVLYVSNAGLNLQYWAFLNIDGLTDLNIQNNTAKILPRPEWHWSETNNL